MATSKDLYPYTLLVWILALYILSVHPQYCKEVYQEFIHCNSSTDFLISCPESHMIDISFAYPMQLQSSQECTNDIQLPDTACRLESLGYYYRNLCAGQRTCLVIGDSWNRLEKASCMHHYGGEKMIHMRYRCTLDDPLSQIVGTTSVSVLSLCNVDVTATSYVRLTSSAYRDMVPQGATLDPTQAFYSSPCTCHMTLPGNTEMQISRTNFWKSVPGYNCDQRVVVETFAGEVVAVFCGSQKIHQFLACDENWRDYVIRFETKDPSVNTSFSVDFSVFHEVGFQFECGVNLRTPTASSSTTASTTTTVTTTTTKTTTLTTTMVSSTVSSTTEATTTLAVTPSTPWEMTTPTSTVEPTTKPKIKPVPPKTISITSDASSTSSSTDSYSSTSTESSTSSTTKKAVVPINENDVSNIVESSDVRVDNTRGVKDANTPDSRERDSNLVLPIEAIIGIAVGSVMLLVLMIIMASCFARGKKDQSTTTEQVNLDLSFKEDPIYEEPKYYATSWDNPDLYPNGKKAHPPGLPPRNSNLYAEPPSSTSSGSLRRSRLDDFRSRSLDFSVATVSSAPYLSAKKVPLPSHPHVNQAFPPEPPLPMRWSPPPRIHAGAFHTSTLPTERHFEMSAMPPLSPLSPQSRGMLTTPNPKKERVEWSDTAPKGRGKSPGPKTKPKPTKLPTKRSASSDRYLNTASPPQRHYKHHIEPVFSATAPDRARHHDKQRRYRRQQSASPPPRVRFQDELRPQHLPDLLPRGMAQNPLFGRDSHDMFFAY